MVPATSTISWSIPVDSILTNGTNKLVGAVGGLASIDMYRSYAILSSIFDHLMLVAEPSLAQILPSKLQTMLLVKFTQAPLAPSPFQPLNGRFHATRRSRSH